MPKTPPSDPSRTTAMGLFNSAMSFHRSADHLASAKVKVTHPEMPVRFLYYHCIELYLKAFLRMHGFTPKKLQSMGHKPDRLQFEAERRGFRLGSEDHWVLSRMASDDIRPIGGGRELAMMEWGLIPFFSKDGKRSFTTFNARAEELRTKPMYREPFKTRRCIVPATGYIEFTGPKGDKTAHLFTRTDGKPIALGGLWDRWQSTDKGERKETYTVVTTTPSAFAGQFHDRMPLVLELDDVERWLRASPDEAATLMQPARDVLQERPLGKAINNVRNNAPELLV